MANRVRPAGLNENVGIRGHKHFSGPSHGEVRHLFRIRNFGKSFTEKMEVRKPLQFSVFFLTVNTLKSEVPQNRNEQANDCQPRQHGVQKGVEGIA